ncbi:MAG: aconitase family protein, partial [Candidatus Ranarchaeia archaeon]
WFRVPSTIQISLEGSISPPLSAKDVVLSLLGEIGVEGARDCAIEFSGEYSHHAPLHEAITITSMVTEMGGIIGFFYKNQKIMDEIASRIRSPPKWISPDKHADYTAQLSYSLDTLHPMVACPHSPDNVKPVSDVAGVPLDQVFIGSCTNGRIEDLRTAAKILKGKKVHRRTRLIIVPASIEVAKKSVVERLHQIFLDAGAVVCNPGCSLCTIGHHGVLSNDENCLSTGNRNFVGKIGKGANVYLSSPATAATSAVYGQITEPE